MTVPYVKLRGLVPMAKDTAKAIKARLFELGVTTNLSNAYEVLATAAGFRDWATMSAKTPDKNERSFLIGHQFLDAHFSKSRKDVYTKIEVPYSTALNHIEIISSDFDLRLKSIASMVKGIVPHGGGVLYIGTGNKTALQHIMTGDGVGSSICNMTADNVGGVRHDPTFGMTPSEVGRWVRLTLSSTDGYLSAGEEYRRYVLDSTEQLVSIAARLLGELGMPSATLIDHLTFEVLFHAATSKTTSLDLASKIMDYFNNVPEFDLGKGLLQTQTTLDQHGYKVLLASRILMQVVLKPTYRLREGSDPIPALLDTVLHGRAVMIKLPREPSDTAAIFNGSVMSEFCVQLGRINRTLQAKSPTVVVIENADILENGFLEEFLQICSEHQVVCILGGSSSFPLMGLKKATTIKLDYMDAWYVTPNNRVYGKAPWMLDVVPSSNSDGYARLGHTARTILGA